MTEIKVGDTVRKKRSVTPFHLLSGPSDTAVVREIDAAGFISVEGHARRRNYYRPDQLVVVTPAVAEPAEQGTYIVVIIPESGVPHPVDGIKTYWVDAEKSAQALSENHPKETFGVLKLVGTVSMQPRWS